MDDLISRKAAIDALEISMYIRDLMTLTQCTADAEKDVGMKKLKLEEAITILQDMKVNIPLPKAAVMQTKRNVALDMAIDALKCSEMPNSSQCISRQAAIDALKDAMTDLAIKQVECLPPTLERLTDAEQRIFLAAMEREKAVCAKVDKDEEGTLVHICREIVRKVKGALWN